MSSPILFLTPSQYNLIYSEKSGILITNKVTENVEFPKEVFESEALKTLQTQVTNLTLENQRLRKAVKEMFVILGDYDIVATEYRALIRDDEEFYNQIYDEVFE